jgi:hypothetical protein
MIPAKWADWPSVTPDGLAPPPTPVGHREVVAAELEALDVTVTLDIGARRASVDAAMTFSVPSLGCAAFDLRQPILGAHLDGTSLPAPALSHVGLGGGDGAAMRVTDGPITPGAIHRLELAYEWGTPDVADARPVGWGAGTVDFDVWCSDLYPGRYLEQWLPVGLCQDRFALGMDLTLVGATTGHRLVTNGSVTPAGDHRWHVAWPDHYTSLSPVLLLAPTDALRSASASGAVVVELTAGPGVAEDPCRLAEDVAGWLETHAARLGPFGHGLRFTAHVWESARGMEYDGATTGSVHSLEHEVFHSWFGRGVKPASANDGWIDEAVTTWATSDVEGSPRLAAAPTTLDDDPVVLAPASPWSRHTPKEAYRTGYRLFANLAHLAGGGDALLDALAGVYQTHAGGFLSTDSLAAELSEALAVDLTPWWDRYVWGRGR